MNFIERFFNKEIKFSVGSRPVFFMGFFLIPFAVIFVWSVLVFVFSAWKIFLISLGILAWGVLWTYIFIWRDWHKIK